GGPLIDVDGCACRAYETRGAGRIDEICAWYQFEESSDHRIGYRRALRIAEHHAVQVESLALAQAFVGGEEKQFVFVNGTTQIAAKLIPFEGRGFRRRELEKVPCVKHVIAEKLKQFAMKIICA